MSTVKHAYKEEMRENSCTCFSESLTKHIQQKSKYENETGKWSNVLPLGYMV